MDLRSEFMGSSSALSETVLITSQKLGRHTDRRYLAESHLSGKHVRIAETSKTSNANMRGCYSATKVGYRCPVFLGMSHRAALTTSQSSKARSTRSLWRVSHPSRKPSWPHYGRAIIIVLRIRMSVADSCSKVIAAAEVCYAFQSNREKLRSIASNHRGNSFHSLGHSRIQRNTT